MIKTEQLRYLIELDRTNSFHKCAENLYLSQPAISLSIRNLEKELGVTLFDRTPAGVFPTEIGKKVILQAKAALYAINDLYLLCEEHQLNSGSAALEKLHIHALESLSSHILPSVLPNLQKRFPNTVFSLRQSEFDAMLEQISCCPYNIGLHYIWNDEQEAIQAQYPNVRIEFLHDIHFHLMFSQTADFLPSEPVQLGKPLTKKIPLVFYSKSTSVACDLQQKLVDEGIGQIIFEAPTLQLCYAYIQQGLAACLGLALKPGRPITSIDRSRVTFLPVETKHKASLVLFYNQNMEETIYQIVLYYLHAYLDFM